MATLHLYIGIEALNMTGGQIATLANALQMLGKEDGGDSPSRRMQPLPVRPDGRAAIFEAVFDENDLTIVAVKNFLANAFGVATNTITQSVALATFGSGLTPIVTYIHSGQNRVRFAVFGGVSATWEESRQDVKAYLALNRADWVVVE